VVETFSGKDVAANAPIVGRDAFTQTAGIHADGDLKGDLYASRLAPGRFGRRRRYALGKLSGKASLDHNLKALGIELPDSDRELVLQRIVELGDKKHTVVPEDLPYIIAGVLKSPAQQLVRVERYEVTVGSDPVPRAEVSVAYRRRKASAVATGDGGYDAFMNALKKADPGRRLRPARRRRDRHGEDAQRDGLPTPDGGPPAQPGGPAAGELTRAARRTSAWAARRPRRRHGPGGTRPYTWGPVWRCCSAAHRRRSLTPATIPHRMFSR
jgi:hypothetical protein